MISPAFFGLFIGLVAVVGLLLIGFTAVLCALGRTAQSARIKAKLISQMIDAEFPPDDIIRVLECLATEDIPIEDWREPPSKPIEKSMLA